MTERIDPPAGSIAEAPEPPPASVVSALARHGAATLHEAAGQTGALPPAIKPVARGMCIAGPAMTVQSPPADNLWLHRALYVARPGDVLVVSVSGHHEAGYFGEIMAHAARARRLAGLVVDGCVRDGDLLAEIGFPVFARGLCIRGTGKDHHARGSINHAVVIGDITVRPGDIIIGDTDGVVALDPAQTDQIQEAARARLAKESDIIAQLASGARTLDIYGWR
jgi:4-hydroxy-4-methyl-2-oxoglutarate aldolase